MSTKKQKRIRVEVAFVKHCAVLDGPGWRCRTYDASMHSIYFAKQRFAVDFARDRCTQLAREGKHLELIVKTKGNVIRYRDTYPRSSDPRRSKG